MKLGFVGLGRMGNGMIRRLMQAGHEIVGFDLSDENLRLAEKAGAGTVSSLEELTQALERPRAIWLMVPVGKPVETTLEALAELVDEGDVLVDGGNSNYQDSVRRASWLSEKGIHFLDVGTSGGIWGLEQGFSMMVGGNADAVRLLKPALGALAPDEDKGWGHVGPSGSGHFVKMVHNGIEYGLMQAYAEGLELLNCKPEYDLDLGQVTQIWQHGSVIRSWLLDLTADALAGEVDLNTLDDYVGDSGTGRWTVAESVLLGVPAPVITLALQMRFRSQQERSFAGRILAAMRYKFGGHAYRTKPTKEMTADEDDNTDL